jgi:hypothetical protein
MPPDQTPRLLEPSTWTLIDWLAFAALSVIALFAAWRIGRRWRGQRRMNAAKSAEVLEFATASARYSWAAERRFAESWRLMPAGFRPRPMDDPPEPPTRASRQIAELRGVRSALSEVHRLFNVYAASAPDPAAQDRAEWWREQHERRLLTACGDLRSAIADAECGRFPLFSVTSRQLQAALATAQTSPR